jgi:hypothetical protein
VVLLSFNPLDQLSKKTDARMSDKKERRVEALCQMVAPAG